MEASSAPGQVLLAIYDEGVTQVFSYLRNRVHDRGVAEDLTAETFLAAVRQVNNGQVDDVTVAWLIGIARHKLLDHWRRATRTSSAPLETDGTDVPDDPWDAVINTARISDVLHQLPAPHRCALTLRYLDGWSVPDVAIALDRSVHATESLLARARTAFRSAYEGSEQP
jgi:RNA polymerase sigma-70 factor, ECF subfamily